MMFLRNLWKTTVVVSFFLSAASYAQKGTPINTSTWEMYQGNARHTGFVPIDVDINKIEQIWQTNTGTHQVTIGQHYVFVATTRVNTLEALSPTDGRVIWTKNYGEFSMHPTAYSDGMLLLQTIKDNYHRIGSSKLIAYKEDSGDVVFESYSGGTGPFYRAPVVNDNIVYVCEEISFYHELVAYDKHSGAELWNIQSEFCDSSLALNNKYAVYYSKGILFKIEKATGEILSTIVDEHKQTSGPNQPTVTLIGENSAYVTVDNYLTKYNLKKNKADFALANITGMIAADNKNLYVIKDQYLTAINADNGKIAWKSNGQVGDEVEGIAVTNNLVFVSTAENTKAYSKTKNHNMVWRVNDGGKLSLSTKGLFIVSSSALTAYKIK